MQSSRFNDLLQLYMADKLPPELFPEFLGMIKNGIHDEGLKENIEILLSTGDSFERLSSEKSSEIKQHILRSEKHTSAIIGTDKKRARSILMKFAAAATIAGLIWIFWPIADGPEKRAQPTLSSTTVHQITPVQQQYIHLPDGSLVLLNKNSTLRYPQSFDAGKREVILTGEAYFDIRSVPSRPFIVHTNNIQTTVLGTAFNIQAYPDKKQITVTVTRGKVRVANNSNELGLLTSNNELSINLIDNSFQKRIVDVDKRVQWKKDYLIIDDLRLVDAVKLIENKFHVNIVFGNDALRQCRITALFLNGEDLHEVLEVLTGVLNAKYIMQPNDQVLINGEGCQ